LAKPLIRLLWGVDSAQVGLTDLELEDVSAGRDYNLGFGIHLFVMGNYFLVYTDAKGPVIST
jgi:hypothetical protein